MTCKNDNEITCRNLNYWDSVSTLAGEVANPHKTFPLALMLAVILVILMYVLPLLACLGVMTDISDWKLGFFATVARQVGGQWLAWWMLAAAAVSHQDHWHQEENTLLRHYMQRCFNSNQPSTPCSSIWQALFHVCAPAG
jgi:hypothetical protein